MKITSDLIKPSVKVESDKVYECVHKITSEKVIAIIPLFSVAYQAAGDSVIFISSDEDGITHSSRKHLEREYNILREVNHIHLGE